MSPASYQQNTATSSEPPTVTMAELDRDPHGVYRRYRPETAVIRREGGSYIVVRASDVERLATDPRTRQMETELLRMRGITEGPLFNMLKHSMLLSNGQDHRSRRLPMSRAFASKLIAELRPRIRALAHELIERHLARGEMDFIDDFASLLPAQVISLILGLPEADIRRFARCVFRASRALSFSFQATEIPDIDAAAGELEQYAQELLSARRAGPQEDFLSSFVAAVEQEGNLSAAETLSQLWTVILGGSDTTRGALAVQVSLLLQHPEQWDAVLADGALIPAAVSEALRYEPIVGSMPRFSLTDIELDGRVVPGHSILTLSTLAAMRDPAVYNKPDNFDIRRTERTRRHPVFGAGAHRCLGEALALAELEEGLTAVLQQLPRLRLAGDPLAVQGHAGIRRLGSMRVCW